MEAQQLANDAIFEDYLRLDFKKAARKLRRARGLCKKQGCSETVEAQILRDLAVVYVTGQNRKTKGRQLLVEALLLAPGIALDSDLTTPELVKVFEEAQSTARKQRSGAPEPFEPKEAAPPTLETTGSVDCPPDFPGCEELTSSPPTGPVAEEIDLDMDDVDSGPSHWLTVAVQQDLLWLSGESGVCLADAPDEFSCYRAGDSYREPDLTEGDGGAIEGGFQIATSRLLLGYERDLFLPGLRVGALVGYALGGGPAEPGGSDFLPIHAEVQGRYSFEGLGLPVTPFASVSAGVAQVDTSVLTDVVDRNPSPSPGEALVVRSKVTVWKKTGTTFASIGGGASYALSGVGSISAQVKTLLLFPSVGSSLSFQLGYTHGF